MSRLLVAQRALTVPGWVKDELSRKAQSIPNLDLRFADNKSLVDSTTGAQLVTHTRASSGTYVGSDGLIKTATTNEPRFDHNPTTGESLGLLVEEARTNYLLQSQDFATTWGGANITIASDSTTAPDGTTTADTLTHVTAASERSQTSQSFTAGSAITVSIFVKKNTSDFFRFELGNVVSCWFNLNTGVTGSNQAGSGNVLFSAKSIQPFPNGWYRCVLTCTTSTITTVSAKLFATNTDGNSSSINSSVYLWGAQLEAGAFPTSYIPTTSATVTRAADVASITGSNFSSFYNQTEGTVFADAKVTTVAPATSLTSVFALSDGTTNNRITVYKRANADTSTRLDVQTSGSSVAFINAGTFGVSNLIAASYRVDDFAISLNGLTPGTDTLGAIPTVSRLNIGNYADSTFQLNGTIKRLTYWPTRLADTTLQQITQP